MIAPAKEILIVDDEVGIRELLSEILRDEGYRVCLAENATEARAYRARQQPALNNGRLGRSIKTGRKPGFFCAPGGLPMQRLQAEAVFCRKRNP